MLIALAGLSGAGKSTAINHLQTAGLGTPYYAGSIVHDEIAARNLVVTPDNERLVRTDLRQEFGMAVFAERAIPRLKSLCETGSVLLDAVYCPEELRRYREAFERSLVIIAITASFEARSTRAAARPDRPISPEKLRLRDEFELGTLRLGEVVAAADQQVANEKSLDEFKKALEDLAARLT